MELSTRSGFEGLGLSSDLAQVVRELGYEAPTKIQKETIPSLLQGKDVIGQAQTGSGKTAAFSLPILENIKLEPRHVRALILCPTRELCAQVAREVRKLGRKHPGLRTEVLSGGAPMYPQLTALETGVHIVVGTPGRVLDHLHRNTLDLSAVTMVVLDEADRMLEMGFQEDVEKILSRATGKHQTALFSATFPATIEALSRKYQRSPVRVTVGEKNETVASIRQIVFESSHDDRAKALLWILEQNQPESAIVFCNYKASVDEITRALRDSGASVGAIHGDLEQRDRDRVMAKFRNRSLKILVATDVAARGIDIENVDLVVNYELPQKPEIYVHRIGRTGRAGKNGRAVSLYTNRELSKIPAIEQYAKIQLTKKTLPALESLDVSKMQSRLQGDAAMKTLVVSGGRKEKVRPGDILGALTGESGGLKGTDIGKIEIHDRFSYVAVSALVFNNALESLRNGRIKGRKFRVDAVK